ncbi:MAG: hypothetical protein ABGW87_13855 [Sphingomonadaceae bacterium]
MLNILAWLFGLVSLVLVIPATIPFLGWVNWFALPLIAVGVIVGQMSSHRSGRNLCLVILFIAVIRLSIGSGVL